VIAWILKLLAMLMAATSVSVGAAAVHSATSAPRPPQTVTRAISAPLPPASSARTIPVIFVCPQPTPPVYIIYETYTPDGAAGECHYSDGTMVKVSLR